MPSRPATSSIPTNSARSSFVTIVVGVDFSACSAAALRSALRLAAAGATVHAIHVIDVVAVEQSSQAPRARESSKAIAPSPLRRAIEASLVEQAERAWQEFSASIDGAEGVQFSAAIAPRTEALRDAAERHRADLLVVGAYGDRRPNLGMGTMATACLRHARLPVLVVRQRDVMPHGRIAAFVDFSETSRHALVLAAQVARLEGAALRAVHFYDAPWRRLVYLSATPIVDPEFDRAQIEERRERLRRFVDETLVGATGVEERLMGADMAHDVSHEIVDRPGGHRHGIAEYVELEGIDLVVLGTRSERNLRDTFLGSTAERVIRDVRVGILAVPQASQPGA